MSARPRLRELVAMGERATKRPWFVVGHPWLDQDLAPWINAGSEDPHGWRPVCDFQIQSDDENGSPESADNSNADADYAAAAANVADALALEVLRLRGILQQAVEADASEPRERIAGGSDGR